MVFLFRPSYAGGRTLLYLIAFLLNQSDLVQCIPVNTPIFSQTILWPNHNLRSPKMAVGSVVGFFLTSIHCIKVCLACEKEDH